MKTTSEYQKISMRALRIAINSEKEFITQTTKACGNSSFLPEVALAEARKNIEDFKDLLDKLEK